MPKVVNKTESAVPFSVGPDGKQERLIIRPGANDVTAAQVARFGEEIKKVNGLEILDEIFEDKSQSAPVQNESVRGRKAAKEQE